MKTVMQDFADKLKEMAVIKEQEGCPCAGLWNAVHHWAQQKVTQEKEQIIKTYNASWMLRDKPYATAEKYYNETFNQQ